MKILLIGLGRWGKNHLRVFTELGQEVFASDLDPKNLEQCAQFRIPKERTATDYRDFLGKADAVSIVTATDSHFRIASECLKAGKDVFIEKPMAMTSEEAKKLMGMAERGERIIQVGHIFRFNPASILIRERIESGFLGNIRYLSGHFMGFKRARTDVGVTHTDSIHFFDLFNYFLGDRPKSVVAVTRDFLGRGLDDLSYTILDYGGALGYVEASYFPPGTFRDLTVIGDKASIFSRIADQRVEIYQNMHRQASGVWQAFEGGMETPRIEDQEPLTLELRAFLKSVGTREKPQADAMAGYVTLRIVEAAYESSKTGRRIRITY